MLLYEITRACSRIRCYTTHTAIYLAQAHDLLSRRVEGKLNSLSQQGRPFHHLHVSDAAFLAAAGHAGKPTQGREEARLALSRFVLGLCSWSPATVRSPRSTEYVASLSILERLKILCKHHRIYCGVVEIERRCTFARPGVRHELTIEHWHCCGCWTYRWCHAGRCRRATCRGTPRTPVLLFDNEGLDRPASLRMRKTVSKTCFQILYAYDHSANSNAYEVPARSKIVRPSTSQKQNKTSISQL